MSSDHLDIEPIKSRKFTVEQVDQALLVLAINGGNSERTAEQLKEQGIDLDAATLRRYRNNYYPRRYLHIQQNYGRQLEDVLVAGQREIALSATLKALEGVQGIDWDRINPGDRARAVQALQTTAGIGTDKLLTLTGRPAQITEQRDAGQLLKSLGTRFRGLVIDGEAVEITSEPETTPGQLCTVRHEPNAHE